MHCGRLTTEEMTALLQGAALCVDATHPYAVDATKNIRAACAVAGVEYLSLIHIFKQLLGSARPLYVLPGCCLGGAAFCLLCDLIARSLFAPMELSISAVTAVFGAPVVIGLLLRRNREDVR